MKKKDKSPGGDQPDFDITEREKKFWARFKKRFPTDDHAEEYLVKQCILSKPKCCKKRKLDIHAKERSATCRNCKQVTWFTSGTLFQGIRKFRYWVAALFVFEEGLVISICSFAKRIGCAYSTAWAIFQKLRMLIGRSMNEQGRDMPCFIFGRLINRRTRKSLPEEHPFIECNTIVKEAVLEGNEIDEQNAKISAMIDALEPEQKLVLEHLTEEPKHVDVVVQETKLPVGFVVATLVELELSGLVKCVSGRYALVPRPKKKLIHLMAPVTNFTGTEVPPLKTLAGMIGYLKSHFHGVSLKYLQLSIASLWTMAVPQRWGKGILLKTCLQVDNIKAEEILEYVSGALICIPFATPAK